MHTAGSLGLAEVRHDERWKLESGANRSKSLTFGCWPSITQALEVGEGRIKLLGRPEDCVREMRSAEPSWLVGARVRAPLKHARETTLDC